MGWNNKTPEDKPACSMPSLDIKTDTCLPLSEICSDGLDTDKQYALSNQGGTTVAVEIAPTDLTEVNDAIAANAAAISALESINPVVDTEVVAGSSDILVTYLDGTTETLDLPEFSAATDPDGNVTFDLNGTPFGPFDPAPDEDTNSTAVDNGDGTTTVTYADGSTYTYTQGLVVDTDTVVTYDFTWASDGSVTISGSDGSTFTGPPNTVDTDTDTFATLIGQTITFANGDTLTVHADDDVETVSGIGVDNTDPRNPVILQQFVAADKTIPTTAFADPECPTQAEAQAWAVANYPAVTGSIEYASPSGREWLLNFDAINNNSNWHATKQRMTLLDAFVADGSVDYPNQTYVTVVHTTGISPTYGAYNAGVYTVPFDGWYVAEADVYHDYRHGPTDATLTSVTAYIAMGSAPINFIGQMRDITDNGFTAWQGSGSFRQYLTKGETIEVRALQINSAAEVHNRAGFAFTQERLRISFEGEN